jgi:hypothetical protein
MGAPDYNNCQHMHCFSGAMLSAGFITIYKAKNYFSKEHLC